MTHRIVEPHYCITFLMIGACALVTILARPNKGFAASPVSNRTLEVEGQKRTDAVVITRVMFDSTELQAGLPKSPTENQSVNSFPASDDWLQHITLYAYNRTKKTISFGQIVLAFPETGSGTQTSPEWDYSITLGRIPDSVAFDGRTGEARRQDPNLQPMVFAPGRPS